MEKHTDPNTTEGGPNTSEQSSRTNNNQTTSEWTKRRKNKTPILSDREAELTQINPKMCWEQISEYKHLTYNRNLDEIIDQGTEYMDPHTVHHIKGDVIWALGPKAKHEFMRSQWGRELKDVNLPDLLTLFKKTFLPVRNVFHSRAQFLNMKQDDNKRWTNNGKDWWLSRENAIPTKSQRKKLSPTKLRLPSKTNGPLKLQWYSKPSNFTTTTGNTKTKNQETKNPEKAQQIAHQKTNRSDTQTKNESGNHFLTRRKKFQTGTGAFAENRTGH